MTSSTQGCGLVSALEGFRSQINAECNSGTEADYKKESSYADVLRKQVISLPSRGSVNSREWQRVSIVEYNSDTGAGQLEDYFCLDTVFNIS